MKGKYGLEQLCLFLSCQISSEEDMDSGRTEVYAYGIMAVLSFIYNLIPLLVFGYILGHVWSALIIYLSFSVLRINAGGYHCPTPISCFITTQLMYIISLLLAIFLGGFSNLLVVISLFAGLKVGVEIIPKPSKNSPSRGREEDMKFKKRYLIMLLILFLSSILFTGVGLVSISSSISMSIIALRTLLADRTEKLLKKIWEGA